MDQSYEAKPVQYIRCILCLISTNFGIKNLEGKNMSNYKFVLLLPLMFHVFFKSFPGWTFSLQWFFDIFYSSGKAVRLSTSAEKFPVWVGELKPSRVMRRCWHRQFVKKSSHKRQKKTTCRFVGGGCLKPCFYWRDSNELRNATIFLKMINDMLLVQVDLRIHCANQIYLAR